MPEDRLGNCLFFKADLKFGVSQGSVVGPLLFTLYTTPLSSTISGHAIPHHLYADDSQLYVSFASGGGDSAAALNGLQSGLASVQSWMSKNKLKMNPHKAEFLLIANQQQCSIYLPMFAIEPFGVKTDPAESVWKSVGNFWHKFYLPRTCISSVQLMLLTHLGSAAYSPSPWSG